MILLLKVVLDALGYLNVGSGLMCACDSAKIDSQGNGHIELTILAI